MAITDVVADQSATGTITDVTDTAKIVLVAVDSAAATVADVTDVSGNIIYDAANTAPEGSDLYYIAVAVDASGKVLASEGTVDVGYTLAGSADNAENDDFTATSTTVNVGTTFSVDADDDYFNESDETFTATISNPTAKSTDNNKYKQF